MLSVITDCSWLHSDIKASEFFPRCHISSGVMRIRLKCFPARLGLWIHMNQDLIPNTSAKSLLKMQTSSTGSEKKPHFSISTTGIKEIIKKSSYKYIKHEHNVEYWGVLCHPYYRLSGFTHCFFQAGSCSTSINIAVFWTVCKSWEQCCRNPNQIIFLHLSKSLLLIRFSWTWKTLLNTHILCLDIKIKPINGNFCWKLQLVTHHNKFTPAKHRQIENEIIWISVFVEFLFIMMAAIYQIW